ncbi:MAG: hypothetical protein D8M58_06660 [Calditrichaeota bacterium]|nr:MAG: hypothetical protein DWQ03_19840 [Calditrichota bacterium]MBL1205059.1 hypothetical protein [Calditrichota bacterium]NOG44889.1 hypothetical protein [Calditrichota bacterium]
MKNPIVLLFLLTSNFLFAQEEIFLSPQLYSLEKFITIEEKLAPPVGYLRVKTDSNSFAAYLRNLPAINDNVLDFKNNVRIENGDSSLALVVPVSIKGNRLWQCMDIILLFQTDFLSRSNKVDKINFPLPDGTNLSWAEWKDGIRPEFSGDRFAKSVSSGKDSTAKNFQRYLNNIFSYSGTQTFYHHFSKVSLDSIKPGDFIVKKGKKGHAVLIVDVAINKQNEKVVLIGQGDTPACQFYLLKNKQGSPWFKILSNTKFPNLPIRKKMYWSGLRRFLHKYH